MPLRVSDQRELRRRRLRAQSSCARTAKTLASHLAPSSCSRQNGSGVNSNIIDTIQFLETFGLNVILWRKRAFPKGRRPTRLSPDELSPDLFTAIGLRDAPLHTPVSHPRLGTVMSTKGISKNPTHLSSAIPLHWAPLPFLRLRVRLLLR